MTATLLPLQSSAIQLREAIEYPAAGVLSKILVKDNNCQYSLFCLAEERRFPNTLRRAMPQLMYSKEREF